jgi:HD-GYP domain-containing protein (c-di-GMP phosphodiesterase class II)
MARVMGLSDEETAQKRSLFGEVVKYREENRKLITIATSLSSVNQLGNLLHLILEQTRKAVSADAASIYLRRREVPGGDYSDELHFEITQNDSMEVEPQIRTATIPISDDHIAGHVAKTGKALNVADVNTISADTHFKWGKEVTDRLGYPMKSMLTIPLKDLQGEVVGVLQLMNKKKNRTAVLDSQAAVREHVVAFSHSDEEFILSIGSLVAASIERASLYKNIHDIFEGYLRASAEAIDSRDRVTAGHSQRVARYAMAFVDAVNEADTGAFAEVWFDEKRKRQFKFAAMLHDFGKIGVPEALLTRRTKLSRESMDSIRWRAAYIKLLLQMPNHNKKSSWRSAQEVDDDLACITHSNTCGFLSDEDRQRILEIQKKTFIDREGNTHSLLQPEEAEHCAVQQGNLTAKEREIINSHAASTYRILSRIPWSKDLKDIPHIAAHHHEKLDGTGYPDHLDASQLRLEERILAVIDIFEALVSQDRPYKAKMAPEDAVAVLHRLAEGNKLDRHVVSFFQQQHLHTVAYAIQQQDMPAG